MKEPTTTEADSTANALWSMVEAGQNQGEARPQSTTAGSASFPTTAQSPVSARKITSDFESSTATNFEAVGSAMHDATAAVGVAAAVGDKDGATSIHAESTTTAATPAYVKSPATLSKAQQPQQTWSQSVELPSHQPIALLATSDSRKGSKLFTAMPPPFASFTLQQTQQPPPPIPQQQPSSLAPMLADDSRGQASIGNSSTSMLGAAVAMPLAVLSAASTTETSLLTLAPPPSAMDPTFTVTSTAKLGAAKVPPASSISPTSSSGQPKGNSKMSSNSLRRGKWTVEEEAYVARVIQDFNSGFLNAPAGTTLRSYLSEKLQCDPMRITKKFTGDSCIGKRVFHPAVRSPSNAGAIDKSQAELDSLERRWRRRLEMQQRESAKKAAASAAAASAVSGRSHGFVTQCTMNMNGSTIGSTAGLMNTQAPPGSSVVTQTASWLDRASTILNETGAAHTMGVTVPCTNQKFSLTHEQAQALESLPKNEIEKQMKEVERLIHEGPVIQQTNAGLPLVLHQTVSSGGSPQSPPFAAMAVASTGTASPESDGELTPPEPADKRMRTGAEDAEALVGFLTAVRASAAAGTDSI